MATAYTVLLGRGGGAAGQDLVLFTVGSAQAVIVRDIVATNQGSTEAQLHIYVQTGQGNFHLALVPFKSLDTLHAELRQRLAPGDVVRAYSDAVQWNLSITGYLLGLEPVRAD